MREDSEIKSAKKKKVNRIVFGHNINTAVKMLIEEDLCVSKAEAKRVWIQMRGSK